MLHLYNTLTREKENFTPQDPSHVRMYVCGPTVYDLAHIGNARPVVVFDVLFRLLQHLYPKVTYVRNITDVDDKINAAAQIQQIPISELTQKTTQMFHSDMAKLNAVPPTLEPRATAHLPQMINMIQTLINQGHAYVEEGHVLFSVKTYKNYGHLSRKDTDELEAGARVEVAPYKKDPMDFVLWKPSLPTQPGWDSPWGRGRPGWHIECSAMSLAYLGETFDIHGGGIDLIFPHHENEIAQSCCATGQKKMATFWLHNGHLTVNGKKMSKSLGNFLTVHDLLESHDGETIRLAILMTHYRQPMDWKEQTLPQAKAILDKFYKGLEGITSFDLDQVETPSEILDALCDDLNIPEAFQYLHTLCHRIHTCLDSQEKVALKSQLKQSALMLGLCQKDPISWFQGQDIDHAWIEALIQERQQARLMKNFQRSDQIRQELLSQGILLEDSPQGTTWKRSL